jgi:hypothetical protein
LKELPGLRSCSPAVDGFPNFAKAKKVAAAEHGSADAQIPAETLVVIR